MKVVFLDIDGVLNSHAYVIRLQAQGQKVGGLLGIDPVAVAHLNRLVDAGATFVLSSTWRFSHTPERMTKVLQATGFRGRVISATPRLNESMARGKEIQMWLDDWKGDPVESFVILDDDSDMHHLMPRLVKTSFTAGLLDHHVDEALRLLDEPV